MTETVLVIRILVIGIYLGFGICDLDIPSRSDGAGVKDSTGIFIKIGKPSSRIWFASLEALLLTGAKLLEKTQVPTYLKYLLLLTHNRA